MFYEPQLRFLTDTLQKCRVRSALLPVTQQNTENRFTHLCQQLNLPEDTVALFSEHLLQAQPRTIYRLNDAFSCHYLFLQLPDERILFIGPYLNEEQSQQRILEIAEHNELSPQQTRQLKTFYSSIPILNEHHAVFAMLDTFGELLWEDESSFSVVDISRDQIGHLSPITPQTDAEDTLQNMALLENRYAYENELIQAVSQGLTHKAELMLSGFSATSFEQRSTDPIRDLKNYCIIMNTLLRKAAEQGGVHPLYLDQTSTEFAHRIELVSSANSIHELMFDMFRSYCRLVKKHAHRHYSPPVQKVIAVIDTDPAGDLSLRSLAELQGLNASYLSALFRRETGETITEHVTRKRMQLAMHLLKSTRLQIQTVAQHCGIPDMNYFSKSFKKFTGKSPKEYRKQVSHT